jgi:Rieske Fe-S protein
MASEESSEPHSHPPFDYSATRRDFLLKLGIGINAVAGALIGIPLIGYALSAFLRQDRDAWIKLGPVDNFPENTIRRAIFTAPSKREADGQTANLPCWVRRENGEKFTVFAANCTHLGCPVRWFEQSQLFLCPCHGGAFYQDGEHAAGPPPRALYQYASKVENGQLMIKAGVLPTLAAPGSTT